MYLILYSFVGLLASSLVFFFIIMALFSKVKALRVIGAVALTGAGVLIFTTYALLPSAKEYQAPLSEEYVGRVISASEGGECIGDFLHLQLSEGTIEHISRYVVDQAVSLCSPDAFEIPLTAPYKGAI